MNDIKESFAKALKKCEECKDNVEAYILLVVTDKNNEDDNIVKNMWIDYMALQYRLDCFDIAPADDWKKSLIKVGGK